MPRKLKISGEPLAAQYNWSQDPVSGRGPAVEEHCRIFYVRRALKRARCIENHTYCFLKVTIKVKLL
jgi:hypothetical protein